MLLKFFWLIAWAVLGRGRKEGSPPRPWMAGWPFLFSRRPSTRSFQPLGTCHPRICRMPMSPSLTCLGSICACALFTPLSSHHLFSAVSFFSPDPPQNNQRTASKQVRRRRRRPDNPKNSTTDSICYKRFYFSFHAHSIKKTYSLQFFKMNIVFVLTSCSRMNNISAPIFITRGKIKVI